MTWKHPTQEAAPANGSDDHYSLAAICLCCGYAKGDHYQPKTERPNPSAAHSVCPHEKHPEFYKSKRKKLVIILDVT